MIKDGGLWKKEGFGRAFGNWLCIQVRGYWKAAELRESIVCVASMRALYHLVLLLRR